MKGILFVMVQTCCLIEVRDGQLWEKHGEVRSRTPEDGPGGCTDRQTGTMSLEAAGGDGEAGLSCSVSQKSLPHGCGTGDELQMYHRVCEITTALRLSSETTSGLGFSEIQGILDMASELKLIITDGLWKICFCILWSAEKIFDSCILVLDCTIQQVRETKTNDWVPHRAKPS